MVFTTRLSGGKGGRNHLETELRRQGVIQKNGRPWHPQTQGKVERFQQTLKKWLRAQPDQPSTIEELQALLDRFQDEYNQRRPQRSLPPPRDTGDDLRRPTQSHPGEGQPGGRHPRPGPP
jgi:transposase InsO family protein